MPTRRHAVALLTLASLGFAACSSDASTTSVTAISVTAMTAPVGSTADSATVAADPTDTTPGTTPDMTPEPTAATDSTVGSAPVCVAPTSTTPVGATPADDTGQEWEVTSFDGTVIRAHWFPLAGLSDGDTAPTVLMGPGWGSAGDTDVNSVGTGGVITISSLREAGFNVLTWDPRGFGRSSGTVEVDSPEYEGRDVQQLLDWVSARPEAALDSVRDPRVGMFGASYGGGIQFVTAAIDCRLDAIVPVIAWHSLQTSLFKADTAKTGWANFLSAAAAGRSLDPTIVRANAAGNSTGLINPADVQWFADRGPGDSVDDITVPTLIIQGTVDTLFTLDESASNYAALESNGIPVSLLWFCGGHGACLTDPGRERSSEAALAWLRHYVMEDTTVDLGSAFEFVDQDGVSYTADQFPPSPSSAAPLTGSGAGTLALVATGGAGPLIATGAGGPLAGAISPITPGPATNSIDVTIPAPAADTVLVGAPQLTMTYSGTIPDGPQPTRVFAQLVDDASGLVLGNQITPIAVTLDGASHTITVPLEMIAFTAHPTGTVTLQIVATTVAYAVPRLGGNIDFSAITIELPGVTGVTTAPAA